MEPRFGLSKVAPEALSTLLEMEKYLWACDMDERLLELVRIRVSQINGCTYCLEMHTKVARAAGESEERLYLLSAWRDTGDLFNIKERTALAWAESLTRADPLSPVKAPGDTYGHLIKHFTEREIVDLTFVIIAINNWNRFAISFEGFDQGAVRAIYRAKKQVHKQK